jgi:hypothetical protein
MPAKRGRPRKNASPTPQPPDPFDFDVNPADTPQTASAPTPETHPTSDKIKSPLYSSISINSEEFFKSQDFSDEEKLILYFHLVEGLDAVRACDQAGFENMAKSSKFAKVRNLVRRYERGAGDARKVFRDLGAGEAWLARRVKHLAEHGLSERTRLSALEIAAKALRAAADPGNVPQGIQIVINTGAPAQAAERVAPSPQPNIVDIKVIDTPAQPLKITE